jgi:hypothetical protein
MNPDEFASSEGRVKYPTNIHHMTATSTWTELGPGSCRISRQCSVHAWFMPSFIDSPDPEDDYAPRLGRRLQLETDLQGTLTSDNVRVFERLHLDRVTAPLVEGCVEALNMDQDVREARSEVERVVESVVRKEKECEEMREDEEEMWDPFSGREYREVRYFSAEKEMYKPLVRVAFVIP